MPLLSFLGRGLLRGCGLELPPDNLLRMNDVPNLIYVISLISPKGLSRKPTLSLKNVLRAVFIKQNCTKSDRMSAFRNAESSSSNSVDSVEDFVCL